MTPKGADLAATDLIEVSTLEGGSYVTKSITGQELIDAIPAPTGFVPTSRTLTINGVAQDLSADRSWTIATGLTIGTTPIASGTIGRVLFQGTGNVLQQSSSLFWDSTNNRLGIGTSSPTNPLQLLSAANSGYFVKVQNTNGGANASAGYEMQSNTAYGSLFANPSTYAPYGVLGPSQIGFYATNTFAIAVDSGSSDFRIGVGAAAVERFRIVGSNGNVLINTTTDAGFKLDVNGTARVTTLTTTNLHSPSGTETIFIRNSGGTTAARIFPDGSTFRMSSASGANSLGIYNSGNVGINTTTDAGFRLDVNGTARFQGDTTIGLGTTGVINNLNFNSNRGGPGIRAGIYWSSGSSIINRRKLTTGNDNTLSFLVNASTELLTIQEHNGTVFTNNVGINNTNPNPSAVLDVASTTQGFLPPRMTTTQRNAISSPAAGLQVYDTTLNRPCFYDGTTWITL